MTGTANTLNWKKLSAQVLVGAAMGAAFVSGLLLLFKDRGLELDDPGQMIALGTGAVYALIGLMVGLGALAPRTGTRLLNVEDAEELTDQRTILGYSAVSCVLIGLFFLVLAAVPAGSEGGWVSSNLAAVVAGGSLLALVLLTHLTNRRVDELTRQVSMEAQALTLSVAMVLFGGWAGLSHLGYTPWISPLAFVAGLALLQLLAIFWVAAKRGLMTPR
jgi:predicted lysophospholipase L1 biosynthesis ABC-type transport system permease subunit